MGVYFGNSDYYAAHSDDPVLTKALHRLQRRVMTHVLPHWIVQRTLGGPSRIMVDGDHDLARRWSWRIFCGPIPEGHRVYVTCGMPDCVFPYHLVAYRAEKPARRVRRTHRPRAKLGWDEVDAIRLDTERSIAQMAEDYQVHPSTIRAILAGRTWREDVA